MPTSIQEIGQLIRTQDNRMTHAPLFLVEQKKRDYGYDPQWSDHTVFIDCESEECAETDDGAEETGFVDRWEFVTCCFTEKGALDYIAANAHRYKGELRTFAVSLYRNPEMESIRAYLATQ